jgi:hypothetical protein
MTLQPIIGRIAAECPSFLQVGGAIEFESAMDGLATSPAAFVVPMSEQPERDAAGGLLEVRGEFGVLVAVMSINGRSAGPADDVAALSASVRAVLDGYRVAGSRSVSWSGGSLHAFKPGAVWYLDVYSISTPQ